LLFLEYHNDADRRKLDAILSETSTLAFSSSTAPHRGTVLYVSNRLFEKFPLLNVGLISRK
jgi:hypothetical protein